ncbi:hypothetical protein CEUSTIGMA_g4065.t1 [Chlamydomonas eustigma]|uniref:galactinol--sucrose galactosyltransferase n=1 Tax=Chlamydomonas eustigma TaxID=1157962 RepID=A0A250X112_9CHLO|nr:hypothetical protein CEUSTIGMA_g4065.t1 [Chlamydomonas eustigma]|eukprot:GAX76619.1 hypothetical protein CEUSTIGMA_g4065.t1 [Chlamydomonas eustigma]
MNVHTCAHSGQGCREGDITLRVESGDKRVKSKSWSKILYVAAGSDPFQLIERGVTAAARLSGGALPLTQKKLPPSLDVFGWCTWDAFYSTVSAQGIQEGLRSLNRGGIRPRTLIIDDGWQTTDVGPEYRQTPTSELAEALHLSAQEQNLLRSTEQDFYNESLEVLAETAVQLSPGTSSGNLMPGLSNLGTEGVRQPHHQPSTDVTNTINMQGSGAESGTTSAVAEQAASGQQQEAGLRAVTIARAVQKMAGFFVGLGTAAYLLIYQWVVEPAAPGSWVVKGFTKLASGPFRPLLLDFFANASDFTRRLTSVRANGKFSHPDAGPGDEWKSQEERLGTVVAHMKQRFSLDYIYCWHGLPAYWAGVMPGAPDLEPLSATIMYAEPTPGVLEVEPSMGWNPAVLAGVGVLPDPGSLYNKMHSYLRSSGVDGVKVDCQAGVGLVGSALGGGAALSHRGGAALSHRFHQALEASVLKHFPDNHCINCMCHSTENLYRMLKTSVARASDDFYPRDPASSLPHLAACAFNGLFMSVLVQPDWDMFHSKHVSARLHAMARAISGGGVYVSDKPGEHDFELLRCLVLPDGSVLRALQPCRPTRDVLFNDVLRDNVSLMKLWNVNPYCGVVGIFHLQGSSWDRTRRKFFEHDKGPRPLTGQVRPRDIETFTRKHDAVKANSVVGKQQEGVDLHPSAVKYAAYTMTGKELYVLGHDQPLNITLPSATGELVIVSPILHVTEQGVSFAPLGLCDMFNGGGAVRSCNLQPRAGISDTSGGVSRSTASVNSAVMPAVHPSALCFEVQVHGSGRFLAYCNVAPSGVTIEGLELFFTYDPTSGAVYLEVPATKDLNNTLHFMF